MPSTHNLVNLCTVLVEDMLGQFGAKIVLLLLQLGRLSAKDIARRTKFPLSAVKRALVSLVHMRLVLSWSDPNQWTATFYEADPKNIYRLMWIGQAPVQMKQELAHQPVPQPIDQGLDSVLSDFIANDHFSIEHYLAQRPDAMEKLQRLMQFGYLVPLHEFEFWPLKDIRQQSIAKHTRSINKDPTTLALSENAKKNLIDTAVKRDLDEMHATRLAGSKGVASVANLTPDTILTVNYERFLLTERRKELVKFVDDRVGSVTAQVYDAVLQCVEHGRNMVQRELERVPMPANTVNSTEVLRKLQALATPLDLAGAFIGEQDAVQVKPEPTDELPERGHKRMKSKIGSISVTPVASLSPLELVNQHLRLLENCNIAFLRRVGDVNGGEWFVPMADLIEDLQRFTFDDIVTELLGAPAARILRVVREYQKMDEKVLSQTSLLQSNELRIHTNNLEYFGFVDLQEVPRSNDRAPGRNIYLWFHRPTWAYTRLVEQLYGAMNKTYQRILDLRTRHKALLAKLTRVDVAGHEDELLTAQEKAELAEYSQAEQQLWAKQEQLDRHVRIFCYY